MTGTLARGQKKAWPSWSCLSLPRASFTDSCKFASPESNNPSGAQQGDSGLIHGQIEMVGSQTRKFKREKGLNDTGTGFHLADFPTGGMILALPTSLIGFPRQEVFQ
jgi:hypothetical protein